MLFFINHCELSGNRRLRLPILRAPHGPILRAPIQDFVPELQPQHIMRFNLQFPAEQPGNLERQQELDVNPPDAPPPQETNQNPATDTPQANTEAGEGPGTSHISMAQNDSETDQISLRRRNVPVGTTIGGATLAEEVDPRVASELVSGSSVSTSHRRDISTNSCSLTGQGNNPTHEGTESSVLTRESIRTARLNRFERTTLQ